MTEPRPNQYDLLYRKWIDQGEHELGNQACPGCWMYYAELCDECGGVMHQSLSLLNDIEDDDGTSSDGTEMSYFCDGCGREGL